MRRLSLFRALALAVIALQAPAAFSQTAADPERAFRDAVVHKQLYLQNFSAEEEIKATWDGASLRLPIPRYRALAAFVPASVEITAARIRLHGALQLVMRDAATEHHFLLDSVRMPATITVEVHGADAAATLPHLRDLLFFKDINEALRNVPPLVRKFVPPSNVEPKRSGSAATPAACDCADTSPACKDHAIGSSIGGVAPKVIQSADPVMPTFVESQAAHVAVQVEKDGSNAGAWILRYGDPEVARAFAASVATYSFKPATCHNVPVAVAIEANIAVQNE